MNDPLFKGSMPAFYDRYLGPVSFLPYATEMAQRIKVFDPKQLLETACGTGLVTYAIADALPNTEVMATDLSQPMLDFAAAKRSDSAIVWRQADAQALPFDGGSFDAVVCQFGVMFFPDKAKGFSEARRVLKVGGRFLFAVWSDLERNELPRVNAGAIATMFPDDPPTFMRRVPYGYNDENTICAQLREAGFTDILIDRVNKTLNVPSAHDYAYGATQGGPLRNEIEKRDPKSLDRATEIATEAIAKHFGSSSFSVTSQALFITAH
jgi:SAM-dependent methyltransferase